MVKRQRQSPQCFRKGAPRARFVVAPRAIIEKCIMASAIGSTFNETSSAHPFQSEKRDVISTRAPAAGRRSAISAGVATLS